MPAPFDEVRLSESIEWGVNGGPVFKTTLLEATSGKEFRNRNWEQSLANFTFNHLPKTQAEMDELVAFFRSRNGGERGFRFRDWMDYKHDMDALSPATKISMYPATGDGSNDTFQLAKRYSDADTDETYTYIRPIAKPVEGTITVYVNDVLQTETTHYSIDYTTGVVTFVTPPPNTQAVEWAGEFDLPVRFVNDTMPIKIEMHEQYSWASIAVEEVRDPSVYIPQPTVTKWFHDVRLDPMIAFGAVGGPEFKNNVFKTAGSVSSRIMQWDEAKGNYDVSQPLKDTADFNALLTFFRCRFGRAFGFRFRDWQDYDITSEHNVNISGFTRSTSFTNSGAPAGQWYIVNPAGYTWEDEGYVPGVDITIDGALAGTYRIVGVDPSLNAILVEATLANTSYVATGSGVGATVDEVPDGATNRFQLVKAYLSGLQAHLRPIRKPIPSGEEIMDSKYGPTTAYSAIDFTISIGGVQVNALFDDGDAFVNNWFFRYNGTYVPDPDTPATTLSYPEGGRVWFGLTPCTGSSATADTLTITNISQANPAVVTVAESLTAGNASTGFVEGLEDGETIYIIDGGGMVELDGRRFEVEKLTSTTFRLLGEDSTGHTAYSTGGSATKTPQQGEAIVVSGEFDVPVRFNDDAMKFTLENYGFHTWPNVAMLEILIP